MPSIADLKKPASPQELTGNPIADEATAAMLRKESQELARISAVLSQDFPTKLGSPRAPVHEMTVETPHIVSMMQKQAEQAARVQGQATPVQTSVVAAERPKWKQWSFWVTIIKGVAGVVAFGITVWTFLQALG